MNREQQIESVLLGVAVGDALGVPVEFTDHITIKKHPVTDMTGYGTYDLPPGTFSDDSSLTFCLAEALARTGNLETILTETAKNFVKWYDDAYWTAGGEVFDVGNTTRNAILRLKEGAQPESAGDIDEHSNGNGSLMRIAPLVFYVADKPIDERFEIIKKVSSITHGHIRSCIACFYYIEFMIHLLNDKKSEPIYYQLGRDIPDFLKKHKVNEREIMEFHRLLFEDIYFFDEDNMRSGGYVIETLEASVWCLLTTDNYKDAVLKAVNMGHDTDTTAAVTGGLAGLRYGADNIPSEWKQRLARYDDIINLAKRMTEGINAKNAL